MPAFALPEIDFSEPLQSARGYLVSLHWWVLHHAKASGRVGDFRHPHCAMNFQLSH